MEEDSDYDNTKWFVLDCDEDQSVVLLRESKVVYEDSVNVGDKIKFFHKSAEYIGVVKGFNEDYEEMHKLQKRLSKHRKTKPQSSFHEERPRSAALKAAQSYADLLLRERNKNDGCSNGEKPNPQKSHIIKGRRLKSDSASTSDSDSPLTPEEEMQLKKLEKKRRARDAQELSKSLKEQASASSLEKAKKLMTGASSIITLETIQLDKSLGVGDSVMGTTLHASGPPEVKSNQDSSSKTKKLMTDATSIISLDTVIELDKSPDRGSVIEKTSEPPEVISNQDSSSPISVNQQQKNLADSQSSDSNVGSTEMPTSQEESRTGHTINRERCNAPKC